MTPLCIDRPNFQGVRQYPSNIQVLVNMGRFSVNSPLIIRSKEIEQQKVGLKRMMLRQCRWPQPLEERYNPWNIKLFRSSTSSPPNHLEVHCCIGLSTQWWLCKTDQVILMANSVCHFFLQQEKKEIEFYLDEVEVNITLMQNTLCLVSPSLAHTASSIFDGVSI